MITEERRKNIGKKKDSEYVQSFSQSHLSATMSMMFPLRAAMVMQLESKPGPMAAERMCSVGVVSMRIFALVWGAAGPRVLRSSWNAVLGCSDTVGEHIDDPEEDDVAESGEGGFAFVEE